MPRLPYMRESIRRKFVAWADAIERRHEEEWEAGDFRVEEIERWRAHVRHDPEGLAFSIMRDLWAKGIVVNKEVSYER